MDNKKTIIWLLLISFIGIVGLSFSFFYDSVQMDNIFETKEYGTTITESFVSPDNWLPGDITDKTIIATNTGDINIAVRLSYTEKWLNSNNQEMDLTKNGNKAAILNLVNTRDWLYDNNHYYYLYELRPDESTTSFLKSVTFNPDIDLDNTCSETSDNGIKTITCNSSGEDYDDATYILTFTIETVQYDSYKSAWNTDVDIARSPLSLQEFLTAYSNSADSEYNDNSKDKMFEFSHEETTQTSALNDYRYIGDNPNNYINFNCDSDGKNCEIWRILGIFYVERPDPEDSSRMITEKRMKLVRNDVFSSNMFWNSNNNDWTNSYLNNFLNGDYYYRRNAASDYGLKEFARTYIDDANYYLGGFTYDATNYFGNAEDIYKSERSENIKQSSFATNWVGKIALIYPSDEYMIYGKGVNNECFNDPNHCSFTNAKKGWLIDENNLKTIWLLSNNSGYSNYAFFVYRDGYLNTGNVGYDYGIRPVIYLKADVKFTGGNGTSLNPFSLR